MQIINFLKNPSLWTSPNVFTPIAGQLIHGERLGHSTNEIAERLKMQFKITERVLLTDDKQVNEIIDSAKSILLKHFNLHDTTIYLAGIDSSEVFANKYLGGVSGYAWPNAILLYINLFREWPKRLLGTTLHEFNHCQRYRFSDPYKSFIDWLIFEGLARSFQDEMTASTSTFEQDRELAQKYIPQLREFWCEYAEDGYQWFFGDKKRNIPVGLGYSVGHYLVERFRKSSPDLTWKELIETPSQRFIVDLVVI